MRDNKTLVSFLFLLCFCGQNPALMATASDNAVKEAKHAAECKNEQMDNQEAAARAAWFVKSRDKYCNCNDQKEKQRYLGYMKYLRQEAERNRKKKRYFKAWDQYNMAAIYCPSVLLLFKYAEVSLEEILNRAKMHPELSLQDILNGKKIHPELLRSVLNDYRLGLAFYQYEPENNKSVSPNCLKKMQSKVDCLWGAYRDAYRHDDDPSLPESSRQYLVDRQAGYRHDHIDAVVPRSDILQCIRLGPDVFQYENYCK